MVVVDASIAYKWYAEQEPGFGKALHILEEHKLEKQTIIAPELLLYELANAWSIKTNLLLKKIRLNLKDLQKYEIKLLKIDYDLINKAITFSKKYQVTVYDAAYAVLAKEKRCDLITADDKFVKQVNLPFVKSLSEYST